MTLDELIVVLHKFSKVGHGGVDVVYDGVGGGPIRSVTVIDKNEYIKADESVGHLPPQVILSDRKAEETR